MNQAPNTRANNPSVYFHDQLGDTHRVYGVPLSLIRADTAAEIVPTFQAMQEAISAGYYLAGYCAYEVGAVLESAVAPNISRAKLEKDEPLILFGVYNNVDKTPPILTGARGRVSQVKPTWDFQKYKEKFDRVKAYIKAGDVYQINITFGMEGEYSGDGFGLYQHLQNKQPVQYGGVINLADTCLVSLSPELFFKKTGRDIFMRPMKGTCARGGNKAEDRAMAVALSQDVKNRAENLMIVDLLRNDVSRLAITGSLTVTDLFRIETYPSLHTMTSSIQATLRGRPDVLQIFKALFPCGSVTGAPKIRAQQIINELESVPRGPYCGACGWIDPNGDMEFNVAIRTAILSGGKIRYPVGSGVVYDSVARDEYEECLLKAQILDGVQLSSKSVLPKVKNKSNFNLIETMGWSAQTGLMHLDLHLQRLRSSAHSLGFDHDDKKISEALHSYCAGLDPLASLLVRLELTKAGNVTITHRPLDTRSCFEAWPIVLSKKRVQSDNPYSVHKTTKRDFFETEQARLLNQHRAKEVIFLNQNGQVCEGSFTNIFVEKDGILLTPKVSSACLPGILRSVLIATGQARQADLTLDDVVNAGKVFIGNSARGLMRARLISPNLL